MGRQAHHCPPFGQGVSNCEKKNWPTIILFADTVFRLSEYIRRERMAASVSATLLATIRTRCKQLKFFYRTQALLPILTKYYSSRHAGNNDRLIGDCLTRGNDPAHERRAADGHGLVL